MSATSNLTNFHEKFIKERYICDQHKSLSMHKNSTVEHSGIVESLEDGKVRVGFVSQAACAACHARGACSVSEIENKYVEVQDGNSDWRIGERVTILLEQKSGFKALMYGYIYPLILMLLSLIVVYAVTGKDGLAGLLALGVLIPYYAALYIFRAALKKKFEFRLRKI